MLSLPLGHRRAINLSDLLLYLRTARHLRWEQWMYRPLRLLQGRRRIVVPAVDVGRRPPAPLAATVAGWGPARADCLARAEAIVTGRFDFLNREERIPEVEWQQRYVSHLWNYNLHYFDYAVDLAWAAREAGVERFGDRFAELALGWIRAMAGGRGDGWEPYALSLRVVNWCYALWLCGDALEREVRQEIEYSLAGQLAILERRLERHILANHLQKNLKALVVGGLYFRGPIAERWARRGVAGLWRELFEQVLPDGVHYERSPMYHAIVLGDYLEVVELLRALGAEVPGPVEERLRAMVGAFGVLCRPDGALYLFNDAAEGIAPARDWLERRALSALGVGIPEPSGAFSLADAGYHGWSGAQGGERILIDCGAPGPRYQPGHAHCDLLSFELDLVGRPVVVDAGVHGYEGDPLREYVRSTRAHNTLSIGGREQSEVWGSFRMARRARLRGEARTGGGEEEFHFSGGYSPFHQPRAVHHRTIDRSPGISPGDDGAHLGGRWTIRDRVEGAPGERLLSYLHLHPDFILEEQGPEEIAGAAIGATPLPGGRTTFFARIDPDAPAARSAPPFRLRIELFGIDAFEIVRGAHDPPQGWYCPEFGRALPALALVLHRDADAGGEFGYTLSADPVPPTRAAKEQKIPLTHSQ